MTVRQWSVRRHSYFAVAMLMQSMLAPQASAAVARTFDAIPAGDFVTAADGAVGGGGIGGALGTVVPPGGGSKSFNNTAAPGFGTEAATYGGSYRIGTTNLLTGLGASALTDFTIAYAYKPDVPNQATTTTSARQLRMYDATAGVTSLTISISGRRQTVALNQFDPGTMAQTLYAFGTPSANPAQRIMDGDPNTTPDAGGTFDANHPTEWVFFAMTYESLGSGVARVTQYGQVAGYGLQQFYQNQLDMSGNSQGSTFNVGNQILEFGNALIVDSYRPFDAHYDNFGFYPQVLSLSTLTALGNAVFTAPTGQPGDYNGDGLVDAADYVVWRKNDNQSGANPADGNGDLIVNNDDYEYWFERFGSPSAGGGQVPEPSILPMFAIGTSILMIRGRRSRAVVSLAGKIGWHHQR